MGQTIASNKQAFRDFFVEERIEAGIELKGSEVKSVRAGDISLAGSFAKVEKGEVILYNMHIAPYEQASYMNVEPMRARKLLLKKSQIDKLEEKAATRGLTIVPLKLYFSARGYAKLEIGLCKGKKLYDKREDIKRRDTDRQMKRMLRHRR